ncbi:MAG: NAD-dependent epimerase/dehydratase family protein [Oscillospiraceae bacterium]|nr:NAD-dependent epimerase/dehydratase family protein [Oscillospiraceae bacterium]
MKKVLILGGTYFLGRVCSILAMDDPETELTILNRGTYKFGDPDVRELHADRRDAPALRALPLEPEYDAVIDLCAYFPGDISLALENLGTRIAQYIFVSTCNVYAHSDSVRGEGSPLLAEKPAGPESEYCWGKRVLEEELRAGCEKRGIKWTIFRPSFIYGPYNYAPREEWMFERADEGCVPVPTDATGKFTAVYVRDAAAALLLAVKNEKAYSAAYNLAAPELLDYPAFMRALRAVADVEFDIKPVTVKQVYEENIALPYPLDFSEAYSGELVASSLGFEYTPFSEGMRKTFAAYRRRHPISR